MTERRREPILLRKPANRAFGRGQYLWSDTYPTNDCLSVCVCVFSAAAPGSGRAKAVRPPSTSPGSTLPTSPTSTARAPTSPATPCSWTTRRPRWVAGGVGEAPLGPDSTVWLTGSGPHRCYRRRLLTPSLSSKSTRRPIHSLISDHSVTYFSISVSSLLHVTY